MSDGVEEIRRWHKLNRNTTSQHWLHVDELLAVIDQGGDQDVADLIDDLESARDSLDDAIDSLRPHKRQKRKAA